MKQAHLKVAKSCLGLHMAHNWKETAWAIYLTWWPRERVLFIFFLHVFAFAVKVSRKRAILQRKEKWGQEVEMTSPPSFTPLLPPPPLGLLSQMVQLQLAFSYLSLLQPLHKKIQSDRRFGDLLATCGSCVLHLLHVIFSEEPRRCPCVKTVHIQITCSAELSK